MSLFDAIASFFHSGGVVLQILFVLAIVFWALVFEKGLYHRFIFKAKADQLGDFWQQRVQNDSWAQEQLKRAQISELSIALNKNMAIIQVIVVLFPLLGLLGTITGMITVFDAMHTFGTNAKAMASGISMATIPTMAGMVLAVFGMFALNRMQSVVKKEVQHLRERLLKDSDA